VRNYRLTLLGILIVILGYVVINSAQKAINTGSILSEKIEMAM